MKKNIKFLFILTMFLVLIINTYCFAIDMNLTMNNQTENNELEVQTNEVNEETYTPSNAPSAPNSSGNSP